jgi:hypothetical protein
MKRSKIILATVAMPLVASLLSSCSVVDGMATRLRIMDIVTGRPAIGLRVSIGGRSIGSTGPDGKVETFLQMFVPPFSDPMKVDLDIDMADGVVSDSVTVFSDPGTEECGQWYCVMLERYERTTLSGFSDGGE